MIVFYEEEITNEIKNRCDCKIQKNKDPHPYLLMPY